MFGWRRVQSGTCKELLLIRTVWCTCSAETKRRTSLGARSGKEERWKSSCVEMEPSFQTLVLSMCH